MAEFAIVDPAGPVPAIVPDEGVFSVLAERGGDVQISAQQTLSPVDKPDVAAVRTFLQELKSYRTKSPDRDRPELTEVRLSRGVLG